MFKPIRTIAGLAAVAAVVGSAATGIASPPAAEAAGGCSYAIPRSFDVRHDNGWTVKTTGKIAKYKWQVSAWPQGRPYTRFGTLNLTRFDTTSTGGAKVQFTLTLSNGSVGIYKGTIDDDQFITGTSRDKFNPGARTGFWVLGQVDCV